MGVGGRRRGAHRVTALWIVTGLMGSVAVTALARQASVDLLLLGGFVAA